ncbi:hypothetical protein [Micromonospora sp. LOL_024]|uniref:hypothetical protein n=1 Tax=Micromonospora sp. LOL_024 TaxID=3345412 RepID=UPI003A8B4F2B
MLETLPLLLASWGVGLAALCLVIRLACATRSRTLAGAAVAGGSRGVAVCRRWGGVQSARLELADVRKIRFTT